MTHTAFNSQKDFIQFLGVRRVGCPISGFTFTLPSFIDVANAMAEVMRNTHFPQKPLLVFKETKMPPRGHVIVTKCQPDIIATFKHHWQNDNTLWPCIRLAGEKASSRKPKELHKKQAIASIDYLLLARPDLHVAQGMLISTEGIWFILGIGGFGIRTLLVDWKSKKLSKLMYAFIYRLYRPAHFADPSYVDVKIDVPRNSVEYTVRIALSQTNTIDCPGFSPSFATDPFENRTHELTNPSSTIQVNGRAFTLLIDRLCHPNAGFDERTILNSIHEPVRVPGVVEAVHFETIESPLLEEIQKHRLGLRQLGSRFMTIRTVRKMLETLFDVLEVLRYLRFERNILHRDISKSSILYLPQPTKVAPGPHSSLALGANGDALCFIKCLLGESDDPNETAALVVNFNHAEDLGRNQDLGMDPTGSPLFVARAVDMGKAVPFHQRIALIPAIPDSPDKYSSKHPARIAKFPSSKELIVDRETLGSRDHHWRHELEHDTESIFWLLLHWAMVVQPKGFPKETIACFAWVSVVKGALERDTFVMSLARGFSSGVTHSFFEPLQSLIERLAEFLAVDRHWLDQSDERQQPEHLVEAFQRLILTFILDNHGKEFMDNPVDRRFRAVQQIPAPPSHRITTAEAWLAEKMKKRK